MVIKQANAPVKFITFILWLATAAVGLWEIALIQDIALSLYAILAADPTHADYWLSVTLGNWLVFILALGWIFVFIGSAEYHRSHVGRPGSWKLFGWTIAVEIFILILAFFL